MSSIPSNYFLQNISLYHPTISNWVFHIFNPFSGDTSHLPYNYFQANISYVCCLTISSWIFHVFHSFPSIFHSFHRAISNWIFHVFLLTTSAKHSGVIIEREFHRIRNLITPLLCKESDGIFQMTDQHIKCQWRYELHIRPSNGSDEFQWRSNASPMSWYSRFVNINHPSPVQRMFRIGEWRFEIQSCCIRNLML